jgi:hypothetical protein
VDPLRGPWSRDSPIQKRSRGMETSSIEFARPKKRATWSPAGPQELVFPTMEWRVYREDFADMCPGEAPLECRQRRCTPYSDCQRQSSCRISSCRSSAMMEVHSMAFCGKDDSYVAVDFDKESWQPRQSRAVHWRSGSLLANLVLGPCNRDRLSGAATRRASRCLRRVR